MNQLTVQPAQYMIMDLFPATVEVNGETLGEANKVLLTDNRIYIVQQIPTGAEIAYEDGASFSTFDRPTNKEYTVTTEGGDFVTFRRSQNCGCGSRLRGVNPFLGVPFAARKRVSG